MALNRQASPAPRSETPSGDTAREFLLIETGVAESDTLYASVTVDRAQSNLDKELTYGIPPALQGKLQIGFAVLIPLGRQTLTGYITGFTTTLDFKPSQLRNIIRLASRAPIFDEKTLRLARWMSAYYHCSLSECLSCVVPNGWQLSLERRYALDEAVLTPLETTLQRSRRLLEVINLLRGSSRPMSQKEMEKALPGGSLNEVLKRLVEQGVLTEEEELVDPHVKPRRVRAVRLSDRFKLDDEGWAKLEKSTAKQAGALRALIALRQPDGQNVTIPTQQLAHDLGIAATTLRSLEKKGWVEMPTIEVARAPSAHIAPPPSTSVVELTDEQTAAVAAIDGVLQRVLTAPKDESQRENEESRTILLQGVTASGKTEVYLCAIENCLKLGRRAIVLVPEIALTAQTVEIFQRRFQERVAILHSALGAGERFDEWRRARAGKADIVVGARSAIFAPCRDVGLIIIDEEHDHSYKQDATPRYHVRDVARKRAAIEGAVLLLGSATPSLESYHHATRGDYDHIKMPSRIGHRRLPEVEIVDMTDEAKMGTLPVLSKRLQDELCETVARGEQAIVFLNRRGFATYVQCIGCGNVEECPNCDISLTFHRSAGMLRCHHCAYETQINETCPKCEGWMMGFTGTGTEKVESEVADLFQKRGLTEAKTLRLDRDTTTHKGAHGKILGEFRRNHAQVLIGTQMVTKGLDFPNVTLVGVISADTALNVPDFRAAERTFQLLAQVAGRAGRGEQHGKVLIQTFSTDHYAIEAVRTQDYETFIHQERELRQDPPYPPFSYIVNIVSQDEDPEVAKKRIDSLAVELIEAIAREGGATELLGPVDCPLARVKGKYRFHLMLRDRSRPRLHRVLGVYDRLPREGKEGLMIDVDAMTIL